MTETIETKETINQLGLENIIDEVKFEKLNDAFTSIKPFIVDIPDTNKKEIIKTLIENFLNLKRNSKDFKVIYQMFNVIPKKEKPKIEKPKIEKPKKDTHTLNKKRSDCLIKAQKKYYENNKNVIIQKTKERNIRKKKILDETNETINEEETV